MDASSPTSRHVQRANRAAAVVGALAVAAVVAEGLLRSTGFGPWTPPTPRLSITPLPWMRPDPAYGFAPLPGSFAVVTGSGARVPMRHDAAGHRVTQAGAGSRVEVHGGSFAYGLGLPDEGALPWLLAERLPDRQVVSRAAPGYGPTQAWVALEQAPPGDRPALMVVAYAAFQDERVTVARNWRRALAAGGLQVQRVPAARGRQGTPRVTLRSASFAPWGWSDRSALVHRLDLAADVADDLFVHSHFTSRNLLLHLHRRATEAGVEVLLVGLADDRYTRDTLAWCGGRGVPVLDAGLSWTEPAWRLAEDPTHPNLRAQTVWADAIAEAVAR
jgi:hypothetical protein